MVQTHVITPLDKNHDLVHKEMTEPPIGKVLHQLKFTDEELQYPTKMGFAIREQLMSLPIRVGNEVIIITEPDQAFIEILSVGFLQRRLNECVTIIVRRESGKVSIPYFVNLKPGAGDEKEGMVQYNYNTGGSCGSCSGDCSSC